MNQFGYQPLPDVEQVKMEFFISDDPGAYADGKKVKSYLDAQTQLNAGEYIVEVWRSLKGNSIVAIFAYHLERRVRIL